MLEFAVCRRRDQPDLRPKEFQILKGDFSEMEQLGSLTSILATRVSRLLDDVLSIRERVLKWEDLGATEKSAARPFVALRSYRSLTQLATPELDRPHLQIRTSA